VPDLAGVDHVGLTVRDLDRSEREIPRDEIEARLHHYLASREPAPV
jgi:hypothetical protein